MRAALFVFLLLGHYTGLAQSVSADPAINQPYTVDPFGRFADPNLLLPGQAVIIRIPLYNADLRHSIPSHTTRFQLSLGAGIQTTGLSALAQAPLDKYFNWTVESGPGGEVISGEQKSDIPPGFSGFAEFQLEVMPFPTSGGSRVIANWLIVNQNVAQSLNDYSAGNNASSMVFSIATLLPVQFISIDAENENCTIDVNWKVAGETNVSHYEVLASNSGASFRSLARVNASGTYGGSYSATFTIPSDLKGQILFVQVKETSFDGKTTLSQVKTVRVDCNAVKGLVILAYPNPLIDGNSITIAAKEGVFNGKYTFELFDNNGKLYETKRVELTNAITVPFEFKSPLATGKYIIRVSTGSNANAYSLPFMKISGVF